MHRSLFKIISSVLFSILFLLCLKTEGISQAYTSPISWHHTVYEARAAALGQSTAALSNGASYHANPAVPVESQVLSASSFLFSTQAFESQAVPDGANLYSPALSFENGGFSYSLMMDYTSFTTNCTGIGCGDFKNNLLRFNTGYRFSENFSVGVGLLYTKYEAPEHDFNQETYGGTATAWAVNVGALYKSNIESKYFNFSPQIGLSINDLSNGFNHEHPAMNEESLPGQVRLGLGFDYSFSKKFLNQSWFGGGVYTSFSKYLARNEIGEENSQASVPSGFEALFTTWNSFERYTGLGMEEISLGEQISTSIGVELHFLETLYFRYGIIGGADLWIRQQNGFGAEVDLYYVSVAVTQLNYHSSDGWSPQDNSTYVQATFRIPFDGQPKNTLLGRLFNF